MYNILTNYPINVFIHHIKNNNIDDNNINFLQTFSKTYIIVFFFIDILINYQII